MQREGRYFAKIRLPGGWRGMTDMHGNRDVYGNIVASFHIWWVTALYVTAMLALYGPAEAK